MTAVVLLEEVRSFGVEIHAEGQDLVIRPGGRLPAELKECLKAAKPEILAILRARGGRIANFPRCPTCKSYALYRRNNTGLYECQTCGLTGIEEQVARNYDDDCGGRVQ
jgi:Zn ribbon nucleic-acid-binding protein